MRKVTPKKPTSKRSIDYTQGLLSGLVLESTLSGVPMSPEKQLTISAVYAAVRHKSETISSLPKRILKKQKDGGWLADDEHPLQYLLDCEPNNYQTAPQFWEWLIAQLMLYGNAVCKLIFAPSGRVTEIVSIPAYAIQIKFDKVKRQRFFVIADSVFTIQETLTDYEVIHITGLSVDGVSGLQPLQYNRESMGLSIAMEKFGASFFGKGARPSGYLKKDGTLSDKARAHLKKSFSEEFGGHQKTGLVPIIEEGLTWTPTSLSAEEAQYIESKQHQIREVSRYMKITPTKLGDLSKATWNNIESESMSYVKDSIAPMVNMIESECNRKLFLPSEKGKYKVQIDLEGLLRGDSKTRFANYLAAVGAPIMTINEARAKEGLPKVEGGDTLLSPMNYQPTTDKAPEVEEIQQSTTEEEVEGE